VNPLKFTDKAVKSVRSRVTNISDHLKTPLDVLAFRDLVMKHVMETNAGAVPYVFSPEDLEKIGSLVKTKYDTWEWNYGYSPDYGFKKSIRYNGGFIEFHLDVKKGLIHDIRIFGDFFNTRDIEEIYDLLKGMPHDPEKIIWQLRDIPLGEYFHGIDSEEFIKGLF
jgi:lipoate-protein ligase A